MPSGSDLYSAWNVNDAYVLKVYDNPLKEGATWKRW